MSHHLDTPLAAQNGQLFIDDMYVFSGKDSTVFIWSLRGTLKLRNLSFLGPDQMDNLLKDHI